MMTNPRSILLALLVMFGWLQDLSLSFSNLFRVISIIKCSYRTNLYTEWARLHLTTSDFRTGLNIELDGVPVKILEFMHVKPGKGAAFVRSKVKNLLTGGVQEKTFRAGENVVPADIMKIEMKYTYQDGDDLCFLNMETFEEARVPTKKVENWQLLNEGSICQLTTWNGDVVEVQMPLQARCKVVEISQSGGQTIAKLENGMDVNVPTFVDVGDVIVVTTDDGKYVSRE